MYIYIKYYTCNPIREIISIVVLLFWRMLADCFVFLTLGEYCFGAWSWFLRV